MSADARVARDLRHIAEMPEVPLILEICREASGMPFVAIARAAEGADGRWIACAADDALGLGTMPGDELQIASVLHRLARNDRGLVMVGGKCHPRRISVMPRDDFDSYVAVPITRLDGTAFGMLCAVDPIHRFMRSDVRSLFETLARLVAVGLDVRATLEADRMALDAERDNGRLREEFIAVVGHDLRNPVAAVSAGLRILGRRPMDETASHLVVEMQRSMLRMQQMIDNLLDFARGRLGAGIVLDDLDSVDLEPVLRDVACEVERLSDQPVEVAIDLLRPIRCDPVRIGQLLSNLLGNAVTHGTPAETIRIRASDEDSQFRLAVTNRGAPIPGDVIPHLFLPFSRGGGTGKASLQGLGLGLYIASEIARAHDGRLDVESGGEETTFTLTLPAARD